LGNACVEGPFTHGSLLEGLLSFGLYVVSCSQREKKKERTKK
jgi:hypothetical protein